MSGKGVFYDPRLDDRAKFPVAARARFGHHKSFADDRITSKLAALHFYQLAIPAPVPPAASYDGAAPSGARWSSRARGDAQPCHVPPLYTEPGWQLHTGAEI